MSVGLPGSGVGGVFYLLSALLMPVDGAMRSATTRTRPRFRLIGRQLFLAVTILAAIYGTGWALDHVLEVVRAASQTPAGDNAIAPAAARVMFRDAALLLTFGTLGAVMVSVQILRILFARTPAESEALELEKQKAA